jgi:hypothetical protein
MRAALRPGTLDDPEVIVQRVPLEPTTRVQAQQAAHQDARAGAGHRGRVRSVRVRRAGFPYRDLQFASTSAELDRAGVGASPEIPARRPISATCSREVPMQCREVADADAVDVINARTMPLEDDAERSETRSELRGAIGSTQWRNVRGVG